VLSEDNFKVSLNILIDLIFALINGILWTYQDTVVLPIDGRFFGGNIESLFVDHNAECTRHALCFLIQALLECWANFLDESVDGSVSISW